jgi:hypothetical protein
MDVVGETDADGFDPGIREQPPIVTMPGLGAPFRREGPGLELIRVGDDHLVAQIGTNPEDSHPKQPPM